MPKLDSHAAIEERVFDNFAAIHDIPARRTIYEILLYLRHDKKFIEVNKKNFLLTIIDNWIPVSNH